MNKSQIPNFISVARFIAAPIVFYALLNNLFILAFTFLVIAAITDVLDGFIARKIGSATNIGSYLDVSADFTLIFTSFLAFAIIGWYDPLVLLLICLMFFLFIATSRLKKPVYDPVGKYLGTFLITMIFISILFPETIIRWILLNLFMIFCVISIISRLIHLHRKKSIIKKKNF